MRVLVVEDEARMARLLRRALEEEGHAVDTAGDGPEGLWLATENHYAAIILDVMLPGLDGIEVCRRLRAAGEWAPVLMLTARDQIGDRVRGLDAGADDYLVKPFSLLELAARLRALVRRDDRIRPAVLAVGDLRLDPARKQAWRDGTELRLSPREFSLLEFFLRHPGTVLTRSQIIEAVWDFCHAVDDSVDRPASETRRRERDRFEQCAVRQSAGAPVEVVDAVVARVERVHERARIRRDLEAPRLRVVAARRPSRQLQHLTDDRHCLEAFAFIFANCRRAMT